MNIWIHIRFQHEYETNRQLDYRTVLYKSNTPQLMASHRYAPENRPTSHWPTISYEQSVKIKKLKALEDKQSITASFEISAVFFCEFCYKCQSFDPFCISNFLTLHSLWVWYDSSLDLSAVAFRSPPSRDIQFPSGCIPIADSHQSSKAADAMQPTQVFKGKYYTCMDWMVDFMTTSDNNNNL